MQNRKIPLFYHIPKNAGTYVSDWFLIAFRHYKRTNDKEFSEKCSIKCLQVINNDFIVAKILVGDQNNFCENCSLFLKNTSTTELNIKLQDISKEVLNNFFLFGIIIESLGFIFRKHILDTFKDYNFHQFLILREPFSRAQSIYNYNISKESLNDYSHGLIKAKTFEDYIMSEQLEDSWLIRNLLNVDNLKALEENDYQNTLKILKSFNVYDIKNTDKAIQQTFKECYEIDTKNIELKPWDVLTKNETYYKKIDIEEIPKQHQETFKQRTIWDNILYKEIRKYNKMKLLDEIEIRKEQ